jgi:predicted nucleic acid-binding protein
MRNLFTVFLETTIFNRYFEYGREHNRETLKLFEMINNGETKAYTSTAVLEEIDRSSEPKRSQMLNLIKEYSVSILDVSSAADELANIYVDMGVVPIRFRTDGIHIATAAINNLDFIVSLNFHHINKVKTKMATDIINRMKGYSSPAICIPAEVLNDE